jgi:hypothetical protein
LKLTVLPQAEAMGSTVNVLASLGLRLRQHCQFLMLDILFKTIFWEGINKEKRISINAESKIF